MPQAARDGAREVFVEPVLRGNYAAPEQEGLQEGPQEVPGPAKSPEATAVDTAELLKLIYESALKEEGIKRRAALKEMEKKADNQARPLKGHRRRPWHHAFPA